MGHQENLPCKIASEESDTMSASAVGRGSRRQRGLFVTLNS